MASQTSPLRELCISFNNNEELTFCMIDSLLHTLLSPSYQSITNLPPSELFDDILTLLFQNPSLLTRYAQLSTASPFAGKFTNTLHTFLKHVQSLKERVLSSHDINQFLCTYILSTLQEIEERESGEILRRMKGTESEGK